MNTVTIYAHPGGVLGMSRRPPAGTECLITCSAAAARRVIEATAPTSIDGRSRLVPGLPESNPRLRGLLCDLYREVLAAKLCPGWLAPRVPASIPEGVHPHV